MTASPTTASTVAAISVRKAASSAWAAVGAIALITAICWGLARYSHRAAAREPFPDARADMIATPPARAPDAPAPARA